MPPLQLVSATVNDPPNPTTGSITLTFNDNVFLADYALDPANWSIVNNMNNLLLTIQSIGFSSSSINLITSEQDTGFTYTINMPQIGISNFSTGCLLIAPFSVNIIGQGTGPTILYSRLVNETTVELQYSKPVVIADAVTSSNYTISGGIRVASVSQTPNSNTIFRITTFQKMIPNTIYTVSIFNVKDLAGNPV